MFIQTMSIQTNYNRQPSQASISFAERRHNVHTGALSRTLHDHKKTEEDAASGEGEKCTTVPVAMGSWDNTVRVWSREEGENGPGFECVNVLRYDGRVGSVTARGGHLLVSAGVEVLVHDLGTGQVLRKFQNLHTGHVNCLEGSHSGHMLFTGSRDGLLLAHDLRMRDPTSTLWHFKASVHSLALEDPWLACSTGDGGVVLLNTEVAL
ncbi:WD_REPEATS_REGION domain-containing protein, partial [Haematococcus lacustris]